MSDATRTAIPSTEGQITFFYYADMDAAERFYGTVLGFEKTFDKGWVKFFRLADHAQVGLIDEARGHHKAGHAGGVMLSIETSELEAWYARAKAGGAEFIKPLNPDRTTNELVNAFLMRDPGGYSVEFFRFNETA
ncbi:VOC family protein [Nitratireductor pacificus]|uniref:Glyoxalase/bleomycin resistance protein/dioxygenase n=1 Tax=Nitratireductor pacificus pht-3B TaxID=391937 RepID=K2MET5_9HYPH|nr:VOC family protein [Nitratireductor pacificus]EKF20616.1 glyoxalase/bleomycin resistance protein/dioxygenase [Nitratireductor pacificus pht-3B]